MSETENPLLDWLSYGDLRSDGLSNQIVQIVLQQPQVIVDLVAGLDHSEAAVRGHTADALEKIGRSHPELLLPYLSKLLTSSRQDPVAMVKMHLAMIFGHLAIYSERVTELLTALLGLLQDESVFAASWAIASLCILGRKYPVHQEQILQQIVPLQRHRSAAIRSRVKKAIHLLTNDKAAFPPGWVKSEHLRSLARGR